MGEIKTTSQAFDAARERLEQRGEQANARTLVEEAFRGERDERTCNEAQDDTVCVLLADRHRVHRNKFESAWMSHDYACRCTHAASNHGDLDDFAVGPCLVPECSCDAVAS